MYDVYKVFYMTYEEIKACRDKPRVLVAKRLTLEKALELVQQLGPDHGAFPTT